MLLRLLLSILILLLAAGYSLASTNELSDESLLRMVLKQSFEADGYTVVSPSTEGVSKDSKKHVVEELKAKGGDVADLFDRLAQHNAKSVRLTLKSSPKDGYLIDYEGQYEKYFKKDGGGWKAWYKDHPHAHGSTTVSLPVFDPKSGRVLIYYGNQHNWLAGTGWIILYKYENGKLTELGRSMLWVS